MLYGCQDKYKIVNLHSSKCRIITLEQIKGRALFVLAQKTQPQDLQLIVVQSPVEFIEDRLEQGRAQLVEGGKSGGLLVGGGGRERQQFLGAAEVLPGLDVAGQMVQDRAGRDMVAFHQGSHAFAGIEGLGHHHIAPAGIIFGAAGLFGLLGLLRQVVLLAVSPQDLQESLARTGGLDLADARDIQQALGRLRGHRRPSPPGSGRGR